MTRYISTYSRMLIMALCLALPFAFSSCDDDDDKVKTKPTGPSFVPLENDTVKVSSAGGRSYIIYEMAGAAEGAEVTVESSEPWVHTFDTAIEGRLAFSIDANPTDEEREADVTLSCEGVAEPLKFCVRQESSGTFFTIVQTNVTESTIEATITPGDKSVRYMVMIMPKSEFGLYTDDDEIFNDDIVYMTEVAAKFNMSLTEYMERNSYQGAVAIKWSSLSMETPYVIYAYAISSDYTSRTTVINKAEMSTTGVSEFTGTFDINYVINGTEVTMQVQPSDDDVLYYYNVLQGELTDEEIYDRVNNVFQQTIALFMGYGYSLEESVEGAAFRGYQENTFSYVLMPNREYAGFAMAISPSGVMSRNITRKNFTTGDADVSGNVLTLSVDEVKGYSAVIRCEASNNDEYVITCASYSEYGNLDDETTISNIIRSIGQGYLETVRGNYEGQVSGLSPSTDYEILACGVSNGAATTRLYRLKFSTTLAASSSVKATMTYSDYYATADAAVRWPGVGFESYTSYGIIPVTASTDGVAVYHNIYAEDLTDARDVTDIDIIPVLIQSGTTDSYVPYLVQWNTPSTLLAVAEDANGDYGRVARHLITLDPNGTSPIENLVYPGLNAPAPRKVTADGARKASPYAALKAMNSMRSFKGYKALTGRKNVKAVRMMPEPDKATLTAKARKEASQAESTRLLKAKATPKLTPKTAPKKNIMLRKLPDAVISK